MLEMNWDMYEKLMQETAPEFVEFAKLYAVSKDDLVSKFKSYCCQHNKVHTLQEFNDDRVEVDFMGEGYYDLCGNVYGINMIMRIDDTLKTQVYGIQ